MGLAKGFVMNDQSLPMRWASVAYAVLLILAAAAFWPGYLAVPKAELSGWTHLHAIAATLWVLMLIAQPLAIHSGHRDIHRRVGRSSLILMPILLVSFVGLSHSAMQGMTAPELGIKAYFFFIRAVLVSIFVASYVMAMLYRHNVAVHSRYMVCTGLSLIDPVVHRLAWRTLADPDFNYQLITFGLVYFILLTLIWMERHAKSGRYVFPVMLAAFLVGGLPLLLDFYTWGMPWEMWKSVTASFAALPIP
jgi:uncharacterized membrane protein YozB (DUF420 family)